MDDVQQQLWTYLNWLQDCGQASARLAEGLPEDDLEEERQELVAAPSNASEMVIEKPRDEASRAKTARKIYDLTFVSEKVLTSDESVMVQRIGAALGYATDAFQIVRDWKAADQRLTVFLGDGPSGGPNILTIPHPRMMLKDPGLKRQAGNVCSLLKGLEIPSVLIKRF